MFDSSFAVSQHFLCLRFIGLRSDVIDTVTECHEQREEHSHRFNYCGMDSSTFVSRKGTEPTLLVHEFPVSREAIILPKRESMHCQAHVDIIFGLHPYNQSKDQVRAYTPQLLRPNRSAGCRDCTQKGRIEWFENTYRKND